MGMHRAGFDVIGVDIKRQPRYPFTFVQADALKSPFDLDSFDFIWASPPCQRWTAPVQQRGIAHLYPDHIEQVRSALTASGVLYSIENVPRSPVRAIIILSGCMFGMSTYRKRHFETNFLVLAPRPGAPFGPKTRADAVTVSGSSGGKSNRDYWTNSRKNAWQSAMGIDWMTNAEMAQSVPPIYAEFIGRAAIKYLSSATNG